MSTDYYSALYTIVFHEHLHMRQVRAVEYSWYVPEGLLLGNLSTTPFFNNDRSVKDSLMCLFGGLMSCIVFTPVLYCIVCCITYAILVFPLFRQV